MILALQKRTQINLNASFNHRGWISNKVASIQANNLVLYSQEIRAQIAHCMFQKKQGLASLQLQQTDSVWALQTLQIYFNQKNTSLWSCTYPSHTERKKKKVELLWKVDHYPAILWSRSTYWAEGFTSKNIIRSFSTTDSTYLASRWVMTPETLKERNWTGGWGRGWVLLLWLKAISQLPDSEWWIWCKHPPLSQLYQVLTLCLT